MLQEQIRHVPHHYPFTLVSVNTYHKLDCYFASYVLPRHGSVSRSPEKGTERA